LSAASSRFLVAALLGMTAAACELERVDIPRPEAQVSLHSVLSASAQTQVVLLERTRNGSVTMLAPPFDQADPVVSDEGIAESFATVQLTTPSGATLTAVEDRFTRGDGKGAGIYRFTLPGSTLERNAIYHLTVRTLNDELLTAETSVPSGSPAITAEQRAFDRAKDTLIVEWQRVAGARSYFVRIETPFGPRAFFTDSTRVRLTGELRNTDLQLLPKVFIPGFPQAVTVSAVDANYYDWYRSRNDAVTGLGLIDRVEGGYGMFGSLVRLRFENLSVVAPQTEPTSGHYEFFGTSAERASTPFLWLDLYVESRAARSDQSDALSGRYMERPVLGRAIDPLHGLLGSLKGTRIELAFLTTWFAQDTTDVFVGEVRGDTIVGSYRLNGGIVRFVKQ